MLGKVGRVGQTKKRKEVEGRRRGGGGGQGAGFHWRSQLLFRSLVHLVEPGPGTCIRWTAGTRLQVRSASSEPEEEQVVR